MMINLPQLEMYSDWKGWAKQLTQELQTMLDTIPLKQGVDGEFTSSDGQTITVRAGIVIKVVS